MKWIEFIQVRSSPLALKGYLPLLTSELDKLKHSEIGVETFVMQHGLFDGDMAIVLLWNNKKSPVKTREGLLLAELLQQCGQTAHAVWIPVQNSL